MLKCYMQYCISYTVLKWLFMWRQTEKIRKQWIIAILSGRHMLNHVHVAARADYVNFPRAVNMVNYLIDH